MNLVPSRILGSIPRHDHSSHSSVLANRLVRSYECLLRLCDVLWRTLSVLILGVNSEISALIFRKTKKMETYESGLELCLGFFDFGAQLREHGGCFRESLSLKAR